MEKDRLWALLNRALREITGPKRMEVTRRSRELDQLIYELQNSPSSSYVVRVMTGNEHTCGG
jgi:hypothetical protein